MAQTISELEKERAKLLEAIEAQASQISTHRSNGANEARPHRLNDWLNAAEQVLPEGNKPMAASPVNKKATREPTRPVSASQARTKASFFGVIIMLSLLLTILGVIYIAYTSIQKDLRQVLAAHNQTLEDLSALQADLQALAKTVEEGGDSEAFSAINTRLTQFEQELSGIKQLQSTPSSAGGVSANALQAISQKMERQMDARVQSLLQQIQRAGINVNTPTQTVAPVDSVAAVELVEMEVAEPVAPAAPRVEQKVVRLVQPAAQTSATNKNVSPDVAWLNAQNEQSYTLQLASMTDAAALEKLKRDKNLLDAKIVPQYRDGKVNYVLVRGSYAERTQANQASLSVKETTGISPWIRRVKDLNTHLTQP
ncbi:MAG: SPOR domain-containing protein [Thiomicrospira sp.]